MKAYDEIMKCFVYLAIAFVQVMLQNSDMSCCCRANEDRCGVVIFMVGEQKKRKNVGCTNKKFYLCSRLP